MLDSYLFGTVERISPEAPVPIIDVTSKQYKLGGAANVAANIINLGGNPILCSIIGKDQNGEIFLSLLKKIKISTYQIHQSSTRITTNKTRIIGNNHQMLRIDEEIKTEIDEEDQNYLLKIINSVFERQNEFKINCILFQDYDKGILNEYIINYITNLAQSLNIPIIADPKKNNFNFYKNITLFKPNFKEFKESININSSNRDELLKNGAEILHKKGIEIIFVTLSEDGIFVSYKKDDNIINKIIPASIINVVDVSGAGDVVLSIIPFLLDELDIEKIAKIANIAGGMVCEEIGVGTINKDKLMKEIDILNII